MSASRLSRLVNLTMALMATRRPLTVAELATAVYAEPGEDGSPVAPDPADEAFRRMFERDKETLREQGVPIVASPVSVWDDTEVGYRVPRQDYSLPDLNLDADEAAALGLAARLWQSSRLSQGVTSALRKLEAVDPRVRSDPSRVGGPDGPDRADVTEGTQRELPTLSASVASREAAFEPVLAALQERQAVRFAYLGARDERPRERQVEPWGVVSWRGHWYLVGLDRDRGEDRVFRLSRVVSAVRTLGRAGAVQPPAGVDLRARVAAVAAREPQGHASVRVPPGAAHALRARATSAEAAGGVDVLTVPYADAGRLAESVAGLAPGVVVDEPPVVRDEVVRLLAAALAAHEPAPAPPPAPAPAPPPAP